MTGRCANASLVVAAASLLGLAGAAACGGGEATQEDRLLLEEMGPPAFDPTRYSPGPRPLPRGPLPTEIVFGTPPFFSAERQQQGLRLLSAYLEEELGLPVRTLVASSYEAAVEDLAEGRTHVAQLSPYSMAVALRSIRDLEPIAVTVAQGTTTYASYLVVRSDSDLETVSQLKGRRLGVTDRWSASGYLYPRAFLEKRGLHLGSEVEPVWLGSHDHVLDAVLAGEVDVGAVSSDTLVAHRALGLGGRVRILAKPGRIPYDAVVTRSTLDPSLIWKLRRAFLTLSVHTARGGAVLEHYNVTSGFMPIPAGHYDEVETVARLTEGRP